MRALARHDYLLRSVLSFHWYISLMLELFTCMCVFLLPSPAAMSCFGELCFAIFCLLFDPVLCISQRVLLLCNHVTVAPSPSPLVDSFFEFNGILASIQTDSASHLRFMGFTSFWFFSALSAHSRSITRPPSPRFSASHLIDIKGAVQRSVSCLIANGCGLTTVEHVLQCSSEFLPALHGRRLGSEREGSGCGARCSRRLSAAGVPARRPRRPRTIHSHRRCSFALGNLQPWADAMARAKTSIVSERQRRRNSRPPRRRIMPSFTLAFRMVRATLIRVLY
jgi:hypothetical protein